jgi:arginine metabolism regulation protein II
MGSESPSRFGFIICCERGYFHRRCRRIHSFFTCNRSKKVVLTNPKMKDCPAVRMDSTTDFNDLLPQQESPRNPGCVKIPDSIKLTFINSKDDIRWLSAESAARHRHSIFTGLSPSSVDTDHNLIKFADDERRDMSLKIVSSVPGQNPSKAIDDLERYHTDAKCSDPSSFLRGPFGAFRWPQPSHSDLPLCDVDEPPHFLDGWLDQLEDIPTDDDTSPAALAFNLLETDVYNACILEGSEIIFRNGSEIQYFEPTIQPHLNPFLDGGNIEGWSLLSHYRDRIVPLISPLRPGQKTPWSSLVIPCAVTTLGELALNGTVNHARLALLNAVWSTSAFHLGNNPMACLDQWNISGEEYLKRSQYHLQRCMEQSCISSSKTSKYKEVLMAILSLSNAFVRHPQGPA